MSRPRALNPSTRSRDFADTVSIDLHGYSEDQAKQKVLQGLQEVTPMRWDRMRIITGRGNHINSKGERGTLYKNCQEWLASFKIKAHDIEQFDGYYEISFDNNNPRSSFDIIVDAGLKYFLLHNMDAIKQQLAEEDIGAMYAMAHCYDHGIGVKKNYATATKLFQQIETHTHEPMVQHDLGCRYYLGKGIRQSDVDAIRFFEAAAAQQHTLAFLMLGNIFWQGTDKTKADTTRALKNFHSAAELGSTEAARKLGYIYFENNDFTSAYQWWEIAREKQDAVAAYNIYVTYCKAPLAGIDLPTALAALIQSAEGDIAAGQLGLGERLYFGLDVPQNIGKGVFWFEKAAENHSDKALLMLFYHSLFIRKYQDAGQYLIRAALAGNIDAQANIVGASLVRLQDLFSSTGNPQPSEKFNQELKNSVEKLLLAQPEETIIQMRDTELRFAVIMYLMAADASASELKKGIKILNKLAQNGVLRAFSYLGELYMKGHTTLLKANIQEAYKNYLHGAKLNDVDSLLALGAYWAEGTGGKTDVKKALDYYNQAAEAGSAAAHNQLACYLSLPGKLGITVDLPRAIQHFTRAMELDLPRKKPQKNVTTAYQAAAMNLANLYHRGGDEVKMIYYYDLAAQSGLADAAMMLANHYLEKDDTDKVIKYMYLAASLGDAKAEEFVKKMDAKTHLKVVVQSILRPEHKSDVASDHKYTMTGKERTEETASVRELKTKTSLAFFAVRNSNAQLDAVVKCKTPAHKQSCEKLQASLGNYGSFFKHENGKKYFVIEAVNSNSIATRIHGL